MLWFDILSKNHWTSSKIYTEDCYVRDKYKILRTYLFITGDVHQRDICQI